MQPHQHKAFLDGQFYFETSAKNGKNVNECIDYLIHYIIDTKIFYIISVKQILLHIFALRKSEM